MGYKGGAVTENFLIPYFYIQRFQYQRLLVLIVILAFIATFVAAFTEASPTRNPKFFRPGNHFVSLNLKSG
jgi:uncharacterized membrane protein